MPTKPLHKLNIYMRPEKKGAMQLAAAQAGMSVSAWGRSIVYAALGKVDEGGHKTPQKTEKQALNSQK